MEEVLALIPTDLPTGTFVVLTGGEPTLYNLSPIIEGILSRGLKCHIETAGHREFGDWAGIPEVWVTLSPKPFASPPLPQNVRRADEFKIIVEGPGSLGDSLRAISNRWQDRPVFLHPEWSLRENPEIQALITNTVKVKGEPFRAGLQMHKYFAADFHDPNARRELIPLGGKKPL